MLPEYFGERGYPIRRTLHVIAFLGGLFMALIIAFLLWVGRKAEGQDTTIPTTTRNGVKLLAPQQPFESIDTLGIHVTQGVRANSADYVRPDTQTSQYPFHRPYSFTNEWGARTNLFDRLFVITANGYVDHGGTNTDFQKNDYSVFNSSLQVNTPGQIGGYYGASILHYGAGDGVGNQMDIRCSRISAANDEGCKLWRLFAQFHGNIWGINISTLTVTTATGETVVTAPVSSGVPQPSANHDLSASTENEPVIDTNPAKIYNPGNIALIGPCPGAISDTAHYVCATGDTASAWAAHFGTSSITSLTAAVGTMGTGSTDPFASGPVCTSVGVANPAIFTVGQIFTVTAPEATYDQPTVLSVNTQASTITACFRHPHAAGEMVTTGGGIGHGLSSTLDDKAPGILQANNEANDGNGNVTTLHMVMPIVASLPGNVLVLWTNPFGSANRWGTNALSANTPIQSPAFTPVLTSGAVSGWTVSNYGSTSTANGQANPTYGGSLYLPPPQLTFVGSCTTMPTAHAEVNRASVGYSPVTDTPGSGCATGLSVTVQSTFSNPYAIYPLAYAASNKDPNFTPITGQNLQLNQDAAPIITASTDGYMVLQGALPGTSSDGFSLGDTIETTYGQQQHMESDVYNLRWVRDPMVHGSTINLHFAGVGYGDGLVRLDNSEPFATYYGTAANHFQTDGLGNGRDNAPVVFPIDGANSGFLDMHAPPRGLPGQEEVSLISVRCFDPGAPCQSGNYAPFDLLNLQDRSDGIGVKWTWDPRSGELTWNSGNYPGGAQGLLNFPIFFSTLRNTIEYPSMLATPGGTPTQSTSCTAAGQTMYDANYLYICVAPGTSSAWKRAALTTYTP